MSKSICKNITSNTGSLVGNRRTKGEYDDRFTKGELGVSHKTATETVFEKSSTISSGVAGC
jgi:hypothetical protein